MTVGELRERMDQREFVQWTRYHAAKGMLTEMEHANAEAKMRKG